MTASSGSLNTTSTSFVVSTASAASDLLCQPAEHDRRRQRHRAGDRQHRRPSAIQWATRRQRGAGRRHVLVRHNDGHDLEHRPGGVRQPGHQQAGSYTLSMSATGLGSVQSSTFNVIAGAPVLTFRTQPRHHCGQHPEDRERARRRQIRQYRTGLTVTVAPSGSGSLSGTVSALSDASGNATFSTLSVSTAGTYTLTASATECGQRDCRAPLSSLPNRLRP